MKLLCAGSRAAIGTLLFAATFPALSHTQTGLLGTGASSTDYYQVTCSNDGNGAPASLTVQVTDTSPVASPLVSVLVQKGLVATHSTDATDGDTTASPVIYVNGGAGVYNLFVKKTASGSENYSLTFHCMTGTAGTGVHTGTSITTKQNQ